MINILEQYIKKRYSYNMTLEDFENKNQSFDVMGKDRNMNIKIEYKTRYFETNTVKYLEMNDILIELIQTLPYFKEDFKDKEYDSYKINIAIGWFYKCNADRLIYIRLLNNKFYDLIDLDFKLFKDWLLNNIDKYKLQYSNKTTGTINLKIPFFEIPKPFKNYEKK